MSAPLDPAVVTPWVDQGTPCYHCQHSWHSHDQEQIQCLVNNCTCLHFQSQAEVNALDELRADKEKIRMGKSDVPEPHYVETHTAVDHYLAAVKCKTVADEAIGTQYWDIMARRAQWHATMATVSADVRGMATSQPGNAGVPVPEERPVPEPSRAPGLDAFSDWLKDESGVSPITVDLVQMLVRRWITEQ